MVSALIEIIRKVFYEDSARNAVFLFFVAIMLSILLVWFLVFSGYAVEAAPIYEGF
ncbi:MAG: hypothetical protein IKG04_04070 [Exiguobacterium sp.]|nr:hypothetical protein [Exiguobacterium sp.]